VLWEHVKYNVEKAAEERKKEKGKHAAGVFERQDAYLYGHPQGRKKRFRSPADFFPHLLWLATDKEGDPDNCSCKICSPDGDDDREAYSSKSEGNVKNEVKFAPPTLSAAPKPTPNFALLSASSSSISASPSKPTNPPGSSTASKEQQADGNPNGKYIYRPGELVWFNNVSNWRLGVVAKRGLKNNKPQYLLQPLSNPYQHQKYQIKEDESLLRPWLAWSVPSTTVPQLNEMLYEKVPWDRVITGEFDQGQVRDYVVDGSILSAKVIDASYSLFDRNENALTGPGEVHYNGMFLGAEKIWVGEPVRLRVASPDIVVLIIHKLIERTTPQSTSIVTVVGDVYKFVEMPTPYKNIADWPTPDLPPRMATDLRYRNEVAHVAKTGIWYEWRLLEPAARKGLADIKGRWYETRTLMPILRDPQKFQADKDRGRTNDSGEFMNGRRDNNTVPEERKKNRKDTLGQAVPPDFRVSRGLDGPPADDVFPDDLSQAQLQQQPQPQQGTFDGDLSQFMDLDQADQGFYGSGMQH
jgi:hypothetical protein